jgi:hypothetical protein
MTGTFWNKRGLASIDGLFLQITIYAYVATIRYTLLYTFSFLFLHGSESLRGHLFTASI